jgi:hypothetical protein
VSGEISSYAQDAERLYDITIRADDLAGNTPTEIVTVSMGN